MAMSKQDFIALADAIKAHNLMFPDVAFNDSHLNALARFCASQNRNFMAHRWLDYIAGKCGPNGGAVKVSAKGIILAYDRDGNAVRSNH